MHGRNNGKKMMAVRIVKHTFEIIYLMTDKNPIQVLVDAIVNGGPREDSTRVGSAGTVRRQAVDVSPLRRVNTAIWLITTGVRCSLKETVASLFCSLLPTRLVRLLSATSSRLLSALLRRSSTPRRALPTRSPSRRRTSSSVSPSLTVKPVVKSLFSKLASLGSDI